MDKFDLYIESLIFASDQSVRMQDLRESLSRVLDTSISEEEILDAIDRISEKFNNDEFSFELVEISNGYQFMTKGAYHHIVGAEG